MKKSEQLHERAKLCLEICLAVQPGENVLVVGDRASQALACAMSDVALERGADPAVFILPDRKIYEKDPPAPVAAAMKQADVIIVTVPPEYGCQLWHTTARLEASRAGARVGLLFPPATWGITAQELHATRILTQNLARALEQAQSAHLTSPGGTNLWMELQTRPSFACFSLLHEKGDTATIPDWGDAEISPDEGKSKGVAVIDGSMTFIGKIKTPIRITVEKGRAVKVDGGREAKHLQEILEGGDKGARNIAEFGIGTVPRGSITGHKDDKLLGTIHIALGHNVSLGGTVDSNIHMDGVILRPRIELDGRVIMDNGIPDPELYIETK